VVSSSLDAVRAQDVVEVWTLSVALPLFDCKIHSVLDLNVGIAQCWMVKYSDNVVHDFLDGYTWMFPCMNDSGDHIFEHL
jgi:hypothetical protein